MRSGMLNNYIGFFEHKNTDLKICEAGLPMKKQLLNEEIAAWDKRLDVLREAKLAVAQQLKEARISSNQFKMKLRQQGIAFPGRELLVATENKLSLIHRNYLSILTKHSLEQEMASENRSTDEIEDSIKNIEEGTIAIRAAFEAFLQQMNDVLRRLNGMLSDRLTHDHEVKLRRDLSQ